MSGSYTYKVFASPASMTMVLRSDGLVIAADQSNTNYQAYLSWVQAGNNPAPAPPPVALMDAQALLCSGLTVTSTSTASLNGTYRTDGVALEGIQAEANALMLGGSTPVFADGTTSLNWADKTGASHTFTPAQFLELVHAVDYFVSQCAQYASGILTTAPSATATIA